MPGYTFPRDHRDDLVSGVQVATVATARSDGAAQRHAIVGDTVILRTAHTAAHRAERLGERKCILRARVVMTADALPRAVDVRFRSHDEHEPEAERIARLIQNAETGAAGDTAAARDQLAVLLGFRTWERAFAYCAAQGKGGKGVTTDRIERELIAWSAS